MKNINKGFSLFELLAVVVILGILSIITLTSYGRYIKAAKNEVDNQNKNTAIMATKSYLKSNIQYRPKGVGDFNEITIENLINDNYIKGNDFVDYNKKPYNSDSYVSVTKVSNNKYVYKAYLFKEGEVKVTIDSDNPYIDLVTDVVPDLGEDFINVSDVSFTAKLYADNLISSGLDSDLKIASYGYVIYIDGLEVYNSGYIFGGGLKSIVLSNIDLSNYVKISKSNNIKLYVFVKNNKGKISTQFRSLNAKDVIGPICGNISYNTDEWYGMAAFNNNKKKTITVECIDNGGSKCQKKKYTKLWDKQIIGNKKIYYDTDKIEIKDNTGNSQMCDVNVHIDTIGPKVTLSSDNNESKYGFSDKITDGDTLIIKSEDYENTYGTDNWLNGSYYPHGIYYNIKAEDNRGIKEVKWGVNEKGLNYFDDLELRDLIYKSDYKPDVNKTLFKNDNKEFEKRVFIGQDGIRYAELVVYDDTGNSTKVNINANIDHTNPTDPTVSGCLHNSSDNISSCSGLSSYPFNTWKNGHVLVTASGSSDAVSGVEGYYCTTKGQSSDANNSRQSIRNVHINGTATVSFKAKDNAGNESGFVNKTVKLDRTAPKVSCTYENNDIKVTSSDGESGVKDTYKLTSTASTPDKIKASWGSLSTPNCDTTYYAYVKVSNNAGVESSTVKCTGSYSYGCTLEFDCSVREDVIKKSHFGEYYHGPHGYHNSGYIHYCCFKGKTINADNCFTKGEMESLGYKKYIKDDYYYWFVCPKSPYQFGQVYEETGSEPWKKANFTKVDNSNCDSSCY